MGYRMMQLDHSDADLQPDEAVKDKVFYNAEGRQIGLGILPKEKSIDVDLANNAGGASGNYVSISVRDTGEMGVSSASMSMTRGALIDVPKDRAIVITGVTYNGEYHPLNIHRTYFNAHYNISKAMSGDTVSLQTAGGEFYVRTGSSVKKPCTIHYTEL